MRGRRIEPRSDDRVAPRAETSEAASGSAQPNAGSMRWASSGLSVAPPTCERGHWRQRPDAVTFVPEQLAIECARRRITCAAGFAANRSAIVLYAA